MFFRREEKMHDEDMGSDQAESCHLCHTTDRKVRPWISMTVTENLGCQFGVETFNRTDPCWSDFHNADATQYATGKIIHLSATGEILEPGTGQPSMLQGVFRAAALNADLLEAIQAAAFKKSRMASEMAESAVVTLRALAEGVEVDDRELQNAIELLEFVSEGTLSYVQQIRGPVVR